MRGLIIIEGADATGKTTLAETIRKRHDALVLHQSWHPGWDEYARHLARLRRAMIESRERLVVMDRSWMSCLVYARCFRQSVGIGPLAAQLYAFAGMAAPIYILAAPSDPAIAVANHAKTKGERFERYASNDGPAYEYDAFVKGTFGDEFDQWMSTKVRWGSRWMDYDYTKDGRDLLAFADTAATMAFHASDTATFRPGNPTRMLGDGLGILAVDVDERFCAHDFLPPGLGRTEVLREFWTAVNEARIDPALFTLVPRHTTYMYPRRLDARRMPPREIVRRIAAILRR